MIIVAVLGSGIIAVTYGLARFVFGLFLPAIRADLGLDAAAAGIVGALPFISFVGAVLIGPEVSRRLGTRGAGGLALGLAAAGLMAIAEAPGVVLLGAGVAVCGVGTGLSSPVMAQAVHCAVRPALRGRVNAIHNAGTSLGVALAMPTMAWHLDAWRPAYAVFALLAAAGAVTALACLPGRAASYFGPGGGAPLPPVSSAQRRAMGRLSAMAAGVGFVSSIYWVFAPDLMVREGGLSEARSGLIWLAVGVSGLTGGAASDVIDRLGPGRTYALALALLASSLGLAAATPHVAAVAPILPLALLSAAAFGASYMTLTGFHLVRGVRIMAERPALGPVMPLVAIATGQALGSALSGGLIDAGGHVAAFTGFALAGLALASLSKGFSDAPARSAERPS